MNVGCTVGLPLVLEIPGILFFSFSKPGKSSERNEVVEST